ncbi:MAG: hypothetical protein U9R79_04265 [Armatimonadota bacterium]|nr:hypothetical protein [Armatimonadota bacterium]
MAGLTGSEMVSRWVVRAPALAIVLVLAAGQQLPAELVTVTFGAERVSVYYDRRLVALEGNARVHGQVAEDASRFVRMTADYIEGDLTTGRFELVGNVRILTPEASLSGEFAVYNTETARYMLRRGAVMMPVTEADGEPVYGYAYAGDLKRRDSIIYLTDATLTTCDRAHPHWAARVKRLRYNPETGHMTIEDGSLSLYGLDIPLVPRLSFNVRGGAEETEGIWPVPGYSSRDGLRLGWTLPCGDPVDYPRGRLKVKLTQRRAFRAMLFAEDDLGGGTAWLRASRREDIGGDIDRFTTIDRMPELGLEGSWDGSDDTWLEAILSVGRFHEFDRQRGLPDIDVTQSRARLQARLVGGRQQRAERRGDWWWLEGVGSLYGSGDHYSYLGAGVGASASPTSWLTGSVEARHYLTGGTTPFEFDDIDIETELNGIADVRLSSLWSAVLEARYDLERGLTRDWEVELRRRAHCLTWTAGYRDVGNSFSLGLEFNGIFGNDRPPRQRSLEEGPPAYWKHRPTQDETPPSGGEAREMPSSSGAR